MIHLFIVLINLIALKETFLWSKQEKSRRINSQNIKSNSYGFISNFLNTFSAKKKLQVFSTEEKERLII